MALRFVILRASVVLVLGDKGIRTSIAAVSLVFSSYSETRKHLTSETVQIAMVHSGSEDF